MKLIIPIIILTLLVLVGCVVPIPEPTTQEITQEYCESEGLAYCNERCWEKVCEVGWKFVCDPIKGGLCDHDLTKCEEAGKHPCRGTCWESCPAGQTFVCDDVKGGLCLQY